MNKKNLAGVYLLIMLLLGTASPVSVLALTPPIVYDESPETAYMQVISVPAVDIVVPTVVEVPLPNTAYVLGDHDLLVGDENGEYIGSLLRSSSDYVYIQPTVQTIPYNVRADNLVDDDATTAVSFPVPKDRKGNVEIDLQSTSTITTSQLDISLTAYVTLPRTIEIMYTSPGSEAWQIAVAKKSLTSRTVTFPEITADKLKVTFTYAQPLRIKELKFQDKNQLVREEKFVRFLAQPQTSYQVYVRRDRHVVVRETETGNLYEDDNVLQLPSYGMVTNSAYIPADIDMDGIEDYRDNCLRIENPDQTDIDGNGLGDACDDWDRDGKYNQFDNCVNVPNSSQEDKDKDGIGDACDENESRFTEANPWVPWVGMGTAALVLFFLFVLVSRRPLESGEEKIEEKKEDEADDQ
jgi:hypothetical protein